MSEKKLYIIDGHAMIYRAYFAFIRNPLRNSRGENTSAIFGFTRMLVRLLKKFKPSHLLVAFDSKKKTFRHEMFEKYKAQRKPMPEDMKPQVEEIKRIVPALGLKAIEMEGFEADDIIGSAVKNFKKNAEVIIISRDKDLSQLIGPDVHMLLPNIGGTSEEDFTLVTEKNSAEYFEIRPDKVIDLLSLMGDSSDNIPGVPGIGPKTALPLIEEFGGLDDIYKNLHKIKSESIRKKLEEGRDSATLSRELATIHTDLELDTDWNGLAVGTPDIESVTEIFERTGIKSLYKELDIAEKTQERPGYDLILDIENLKKAVAKLREQKVFCFDCETDGLDFLNNRIIGMSFSYKEQQAFYVAFTTESIFNKSKITTEDGLEVLKPALVDPEILKVGQNMKFDILFLSSAGIHVKGEMFDTMLASFLLDPSQRHNMDDMALRHLNYKTITYDDLTGTGKNRKNISEIEVEKVAEYSGEDADITFRLYKLFDPKIREMKLEGLFHDIDMPLMPVLASMERTGVKVDEKYLASLSKEFEKDLASIEKKIFKEAGEEFNVSSTKQLQKILFEKMGIKTGRKTKTGYSTDNSVLEELAISHVIARHLLEYRTLSKLKNTYSDTLPQLVNPKTGRIHTSYNQAVAATGRLSSTDPNLQNIPIKEEIGRKIRNAFIPEKGGLIMSSDYSQIELRVLAHITKDPNLIKAFKDGEDIHSSTARQIYGMLAGTEVTPEQRRVAKTINFGVAYGMGAYALSSQLEIPVPQAKNYIEQYFDKYRGMTKYYDKIRDDIITKGYVENLFCRRRYFQSYQNLSKRDQESIFRMGINTPIQGTAADLIKIAMIRLHEEMNKRKLASRMTMQVHDELVFEVPESEKNEMEKLVREKMENAWKLDVPVTVDIKFGKNWAEAH